MALSRREIVDSILNTTRQNRTQIGDLVNEFVNLSINEINDPGWALPKGSPNHLWSFLRRKTTFATVSGTQDYVLGRDVDKIAILRQTSSPTKLVQIPDERFFEYVPNPTASGNPQWYRQWELEGVSTRLAAADTIDVLSSSASDAGDTTLTVSVSGYDSNGIWRVNTYALNGTTAVSGTTTFAAREIYVSKQKTTTGSITVRRNSNSAALVVIGPEERAPKFKVVTLYPNPGSAITMYLEYYTRLPILDKDSQSPPFDERWHYIVRLGGLAKVYQYLKEETNFLSAQGIYAAAVKTMVEADRNEPDLIIHMKSRVSREPMINLRRSDDAIA